MPFIVGLTGGIASGKTTVANLFNQHFQIEIVDADIVAREVVEPGTEGLQAIAEHFGRSILTSEKTLDRSKLREIIFSRPEEKEWLNNLLHPMIRQKMNESLSAIKSPYALLVIPLMVENQLQSMADRILVIDVSPETQIQRTVMRDNVADDQAKAILASQADRQQRLAIADDIILNEDDEQDLLAQITTLHNKYLSLAK
ncbi:dephospho-CoA kinase [Vibrio sp. JC009]|uniref:dephospho-CoA kinase n=1 Tax=Vibrio sp. JC009 TaxID=2912314 RepID=UPI0023AF36C9|nr:dephospho-CoA kinase [Vibrio sp. JC009]WED22350.1 dephospho-CoA kinase [Vibrio sp. JC009]